MSQGIFITLEGMDASGTTTQRKKIQQVLEERGLVLGKDFVLTREPGGTDISEQIRTLLLDPTYKGQMDDVTEMYLYAASRSNHVKNVILPSLDDGKIVISERFVDSSLVYQGVARNLGVDTVFQMNQLALHNVMPDLTFYLIVSQEVSEARQQKSHRVKDRLEQEGKKFFDTIGIAYQDLAKRFPDRVVLIDADRSIEEVHEEIMRHIDLLLEEKKGYSKKKENGLTKR